MDGYVVFHAPSLYGFIAKTSGLNINTLYNLNFLYICTHRTHNVKNNNFIFHFIYFFQFTSTQKKTICSCPNSTCSILNSQRGVYQEGINVDLWTDYTSLSYNQELNHEILNHKKTLSRCIATEFGVLFFDVFFSAFGMKTELQLYYLSSVSQKNSFAPKPRLHNLVRSNV